MKKTYIVAFRSGKHTGILGFTEYRSEKMVSVYAETSTEAVELAKEYTKIKEKDGMEITVV